jgi:hypothetical protein
VVKLTGKAISRLSKEILQIIGLLLYQSVIENHHDSHHNGKPAVPVGKPADMYNTVPPYLKLANPGEWEF